MSIITQAMILAAGEGRRLRPLTDHTPKPLIPLGHKTMLDHVLDQVAAASVTHCVVNTYHLAGQIHTHLKGRRTPEITLSPESELLDTGGGITKALPYFRGKPFFVVNADIWWQDSGQSCLTRLNQAWDPAKMDALLLLVDRETALGYTQNGDYFLSPDGQAHYRQDRPVAPYVYPGISLLHPRLFEGQKIHPFSVVSLFHKAEKQSRLYGIIHNGIWGDMGTPQGLKEVEEKFLTA